MKLTLDLIGLCNDGAQRSAKPAVQRGLLCAGGGGLVGEQPCLRRPHNVVSTKIDRHQNRLDFVEYLDGQGFIGVDRRVVDQGSQALQRAHDAEDLASGGDRCLHPLRVPGAAGGYEHGSVLHGSQHLVAAVGLVQKALGGLQKERIVGVRMWIAGGGEEGILVLCS